MQPANLTNEGLYLVMSNRTLHSHLGNVSQSSWSDDNLTLVLAPMFLLVGGIGNSLSAAVMLRKQFRRMSLGIYLFLLAMADNATLLSNRLTRDWIWHVSGVNLRTYSDISCRLMVYIMYSASSISSWLIVAVSVERMLVVSFPFKAKELSTRKRASIVASSIILILLSLHIFIFKLVRLRTIEGHQTVECMFVHPSELARDIDPGVVLELFHLCMYCVIPAIILLSSNIIIIVKLARSSKFRNSFQKSLKGSSSANSSAVKRTNWMLVVVSSSFVAMTLPLSLLLLQACIRRKDPPKIVEIVVFWIKVVNHAMNFILYSVSGPAFRRELRDMCVCCAGRYEVNNSITDSPVSNKHVVCKSIAADKSPLTHV